MDRSHPPRPLEAREKAWKETILPPCEQCTWRTYISSLLRYLAVASSLRAQGVFCRAHGQQRPKPVHPPSHTVRRKACAG